MLPARRAVFAVPPRHLSTGPVIQGERIHSPSSPLCGVGSGWVASVDWRFHPHPTPTLTLPPQGGRNKVAHLNPHLTDAHGDAVSNWRAACYSGPPTIAAIPFRSPRA